MNFIQNLIKLSIKGSTYAIRMAEGTVIKYINLTSNKASANITIRDMLALALLLSFGRASRLLERHVQRPVLWWPDNIQDLSCPDTFSKRLPNRWSARTCNKWHVYQMTEWVTSKIIKLLMKTEGMGKQLKNTKLRVAWIKFRCCLHQHLAVYSSMQKQTTRNNKFKMCIER